MVSKPSTMLAGNHHRSRAPTSRPKDVLSMLILVSWSLPLAWCVPAEMTALNVRC